ncbi:MAG: ABC-2 family transporter protein [Gammaproteobacteria bacterium]|nr:ABC-2 family transporter protein [Gammaproteobacteria bacterium]
MSATTASYRRAYLAVAVMRFKMVLQYRAAAFAGFATQLFWGFIKVMVFVAFFEAASVAPPMTFSEVLVYIWLGQGLLALLPWNVDAEIANDIRTGGVAYELLRPLDLYGFWFARTLAFRAAPTLLRLIPMLIFAFFGLPLLGFPEWALPTPASFASGILFAFSVTATLALSTAFTMVMHVALLWTISGEGFNRLMPGLVPVLAGLIIPLPLFPDWLQPYLYWQPFRGMADVPFRIYSGHIPVNEAFFEIAMQWIWFVVIVVFGYRLLRRARTNLVVQGG